MPLPNNESQCPSTVILFDLSNSIGERRTLVNSECGIHLLSDNKCWWWNNTIIVQDDDLVLTKCDRLNGSSYATWSSLYFRYQSNVSSHNVRSAKLKCDLFQYCDIQGVSSHSMRNVWWVSYS
jgi:hypothetical protein